MKFQWSKKIAATIALCVLIVLPVVDLAALDLEHDKLAVLHVQAHDASLAHGHDIYDMNEVLEDTEHGSRDDMKAHMVFHTCANVYINAPVLTRAARLRLSRCVTSSHSS